MSKKFGRTAGFFKSMWNYYTKIKPSEKKSNFIVVGTDFSGNQYAIKPGDPSVGRKDARLVIPSEETASMYVDKLGLNVPQEWDEWLRHRRKDPPTLEELQMNELKKKKIQERVRELELKERLGAGEAVKELDTENKSTDTTSIGQSITENITGDTRKASFPVYENLERVPGEFHKGPKT